jgi:SET and MYND domain-containing protein
MLALYLSKYTSFFKDINLKESLISKFSKDTFNNNNQLTTEDDKQLYISSLLLKHILQLISNGHAITKLNTTTDNKQDNFYIQQEGRIATAIYPSASIMNHSCDPNIINR